MRYRYIHEKEFSDGSKALSNIIWDMEGNWPMRRGEFPPEHPSNRFPEQIEALRDRGYHVTFLHDDGDRCSLELDRKQSKEQVLRDIEESLGWEHVN